MKRFLLLLLAFTLAGCDDTKDLGDGGGGGGGHNGGGKGKGNSHKMPVPHHAPIHH